MKSISLIGRPIALVKPYADPSISPIGGSRVVDFNKPYALVDAGNLRVDEGRAPTVVPSYSPYLQGPPANMERRLSGLTDDEAGELAVLSKKKDKSEGDTKRLAILRHKRNEPALSATSRFFGEAPWWAIAGVGLLGFALVRKVIAGTLGR